MISAPVLMNPLALTWGFISHASFILRLSISEFAIDGLRGLEFGGSGAAQVANGIGSEG